MNPITPLTPAQTVAQENEAKSEGYAERLLVAADVFINVATDGKPDQTISTRAAEDDLQGRKAGKLLSSFLDVFQKDHGADAAAGDLERAKEIEQSETQSGIVS